jgi:hypothetical protein
MLENASQAHHYAQVDSAIHSRELAFQFVLGQHL